MRKGLAGALVTSLVVASALILVALADRLPLDAFHYRFADNLLIAGALLSIALAVLKEQHTKKERTVSRFARLAVGTLAVVIAVGATRLHYQAWSFYTTVVALSVGVSITAFLLAPASLGADASNGERFGMHEYLGFAILAVSAILGRLLLPGSFVQSWILAPLFVLVMPGLALSAALLPVSTGWLERLFWAPVLSVGVQIVSLTWLDWLGVAASLPIVIALALLFTLVGLVASAWSSPPRGSESSP